MAMVLSHNVWSGGALPLIKGLLLLFVSPETVGWVIL